MTLFVDLDGVLADMHGHYFSLFGQSVARDQVDPPGFWDNIRSVPTFFRDLPLTVDAKRLWSGVEMLTPTILTGVAFKHCPESEQQKRDWVVEHFGSSVPVICCRSKDKRNHAQAGDILIDDWARYAPLWKGMGGHFILHRSAEESLAALAQLL